MRSGSRSRSSSSSNGSRIGDCTGGVGSRTPGAVFVGSGGWCRARGIEQHVFLPGGRLIHALSTALTAERVTKRCWKILVDVSWHYFTVNQSVSQLIVITYTPRAGPRTDKCRQTSTNQTLLLNVKFIFVHTYVLLYRVINNVVQVLADTHHMFLSAGRLLRKLCKSERTTLKHTLTMRTAGDGLSVTISRENSDGVCTAEGSTMPTTHA